MAENTKIIIKSEPERLYNAGKYKLYHDLIPASVASSLSARDLEKVSTYNLNTNIAGLYLDRLSATARSISQWNNDGGATTFAEVNTLRSPTSISYYEMLNPTSGLSSLSALLEGIPYNLHISETITHFQRMPVEYTQKSTAATYLRDNLYTEFTSSMQFLGRTAQIIPDSNGRFFSSSVRISGYIKVEDAPNTISMNLVLRGVPVPMRRTQTSINYTGETVSSYNYVFTYPEYLINNKDLVESIQYIEAVDRGSAIFFYGTNYSFTNTNQNYSDNLANLHVINRPNRNIA
jgi:hypothetical protein